MPPLSHLTFCTPINVTSIVIIPCCCCKWTWPIQAPNIPSTKSHVPLSLLRSYQSISPRQMLCLWIFRNKIRSNREELLAPRPTAKLGNHPLSAFRGCLFNIFAATVHITGRSSIRNFMVRHAVVTGSHSFNQQCKCNPKFLKNSLFNHHFACIPHHLPKSVLKWNNPQLISLAGTVHNVWCALLQHVVHVCRW